MQDLDFMPNAAAVQAIAGDLTNYNTERAKVSSSVKRRMLIFMGGFAIAAIAVFLFLRAASPYDNLLAIQYLVFYFVAIVVGLTLFDKARAPAKSLQQSFRNKLIPVAFGFIDQVRYENNAKPASFARMPKAAVGSFNKTAIDDTLTGTHQGFPFELYEARLSYKTSKSEQEMFRGIILWFRMPQSFPGTVVATKTAGNVSRFFRDLFGKGGLEQVQSGNAAIDGSYEIRSDNPEAAKPLVTGSFAHALDRLRDAWPEAAARVALSGDDGFLLLPSKKNFFELPKVSLDCDYKQHVEPMVVDVAKLLATASLVREIR